MRLDRAKLFVILINKHTKNTFVVGVLQKRKWENAMTIDKKSWGYRANARLDEFLTTEQLIKGNKCTK